VKWQAIEFLLAGDVLDGLAGVAAFDKRTKLCAVIGWIIPMSYQPRCVSLRIVSLKKVEE
jgi:hypothetical protein